MLFIIIGLIYSFIYIKIISIKHATLKQRYNQYLKSTAFDDGKDYYRKLKIGKAPTIDDELVVTNSLNMMK